MMQLTIGIIGKPAGWQSVLRQIGAPFDVASDELSPDRYSVIVAGNPIDEREAERVRAYLRGGGAMICSGRIFAQIAGTTYAGLAVRYLVSEPGSVFDGVGLLDVYRKCRIPMRANFLLSDKAATTTYVGEFLGGQVIVFPFDVDEILLDHRQALKSFYSPERRLPFERVSAVSRGPIRRLIERSLETLHHRRGLPFFHLWYYPSQATSLFAFRIDTDYATEPEILSLYDLVSRKGVRATWFVDTRSQERFVSVFRSMKDQEIGVHCYHHKTFPDVESNLANIAQAKQVLQGAGIEARGYAAPFGRWHSGIAKAIEASGFEYSTEFSYDYDNVPSTPFVDDAERGVLQVPVHPVSIGSLKRQGYGDSAMIRYFEFVLRFNAANRSPLFFYHHPKDQHHPVLEYLFDVAERNQFPAVRMTDYARWWKRRSSVRLQPQIVGARLKVSGDLPASDVWMHLTKGDGMECFSPVQADVNLDRLDWSPMDRRSPVPPDYRRIRRFNYRIPLTLGVDLITSR